MGFKRIGRHYNRGPAQENNLLTGVKQRQRNQTVDFEKSPIEAEGEYGGATSEKTEKLRAQESTLTRWESGAEAAQSFFGIMQAISDYRQFDADTQRNIRAMQRDIEKLGQSAEITKSVGHQGALKEQALGQKYASMLRLRSVAQGQKVGSPGAKRLSQSQKIVSATRATQHVNASMARALGLKYQAIGLELSQADQRRQLAYAKINRDLGIAAGVTQLGISGAKAAAGGF